MLKGSDLSVQLNWKRTYLHTYEKQIIKNIDITERVLKFTILTLNKFNFTMVYKTLQIIFYSITEK